MSQTYHGIEFPEVMQDDTLYYIICEQGEFSGWSEDAVLMHWKNRVLTDFRQRVINNEFIEITDTLLGCNQCGAVVFDGYSHLMFHQDLTKE